jgi:hypothetical protein
VASRKVYRVGIKKLDKRTAVYYDFRLRMTTVVKRREAVLGSFPQLESEQKALFD